MDTETDPFLYGRTPEPFTLGFYNGSGYWEFVGEKDVHPLTCVEQYIDHLDSLDQSEKDDYIVYVHNGGKFDFFFFLDYIETGSITAIDGRIVKCKIAGVEFRDSYTIYPMSLASYEKEEFDYTSLEKSVRYKHENLSDILKYQKSDCLNLYKLVDAFVNRFGDVLTVSSAAFKQLKLTGYEIKNTNLKYDEKFRPYYYGGRTEVFKSGSFKTDVEYFDINSAYSHSMLSDHPSCNETTKSTTLPTNNEMYFANIKAISRGALPYRDERGHLIFPNDNIEREYFVTSWEIEVGIKTGTLDIIKVIEVIQHKKHANFKPYVDKFFSEKYDAKKNGDIIAEIFAKLMLNSAYGKFALDPQKYTSVEITKGKDLPDELLEWFQYYGVTNTNDLQDKIKMDYEIKEHDRAFRLNICGYKMTLSHPNITIWERPDPNRRFYNTATAASITGKVRALMWETICQCEGVIYCDTDSIMCKKFHGEKSNELGAWKLECIFDELYVGGKKLYAGKIKNKSEWKTACKGARLDYKEIRTIVRDNKSIKWCNDAPSFSLKNMPKFIDRTIRKTV
ncbi:hypothetical protein JKY72_07015 [Candidatus Gracilibacteria bacterium]|nr:hypothetical protein [Candidatus Gracilibacteria bacterium]